MNNRSRQVRGNAEPPQTVRWLSKPAGTSYQAFLDSLPGATVWQRQMVLGPAPEFCVAESNDANTQRGSSSRIPVYRTITPATTSIGRGTA